MVKLYEIAEDYKGLEDLAVKGDLTESEIKDTLEGIEGAFEDKAVNILSVSNSMDMDINVLDAEIKRLQAKKNAIKSNKERLREYLRYNMEASGINKISSPLFSVTLKKPTEQVGIVDLDLIPDEYIKIVTDIKPDKTSILKALKAGENVPGAVLVDGKRSLLIK